MRHYRFETHFQLDQPGRGRAMCAGKPTLNLALPPEFGGPDGVWNPEELFLASLDSCLMMTFAILANKAGVNIYHYRSRTVGHMEKQANGLSFVNVEMFVQIEVESEAEKARLLLDEAVHGCPISQSISTHLQLHPQIWTLAGAPMVD